jgi:phosphonate transport system substrate-binding protein
MEGKDMTSPLNKRFEGLPVSLKEPVLRRDLRVLTATWRGGIFCLLMALLLAFYFVQLAQAEKFFESENAANTTPKQTYDQGEQRNTLQRSAAILAEKKGARPHTLVIGRVSDDPRKHYKRLKPIVDYVASHLSDVGITRGSVLMAKDNRQLIRYLNEKKVDWVSETVISALIYHQETGAEIIARRWRKGVPEYHSVFFTRKETGIESIEQLKGKKIAFEDPGSTTAYFVPVGVLKRAGLELVRLSSPTESPPANKVGYVFAGRDLNVATWVHKGLTDAGAFSNLDWTNPDDVPGAYREDLKLIYETRPFPRAVELVRKDLDSKIKERIKEILLTAHTNPEGRKALRAYHKTAKFDEFVGTAKKGLDEAMDLLNYMRGELG